MNKKILSCAICGVTNETKIIRWSKSQNCYLCQKHKAQIYRNGKITDTEPRTIRDENEIIIYDNYAEIVVRDRTQKIIAKAIIDIDDVDKCKKIKWGYTTEGYVNAKHKKLSLHRYVMNYNGPLQVDHINRNKLDNRKENLRIVSIFINNQNNGAIGVSFDKNANKWKAEFQRYGKYFNAGLFKTKEEAVNARKLAIEQIEKDKDKLLAEYNKKDANHTTGIRPSPHGKWIAKFCADNKVYHVGTFLTKEEAIIARREAIQKHKTKSFM